MNQAKAYCRSIGLDPDEMVMGKKAWGYPYLTMPRWQWYMGARLDLYSARPA